jgi:hypothetical protein
MKRIILLFLIILGIAQSCRYEEGPAISFTSVRGRLLGDWRVTEFTCEGMDSLQFYKDSCGCDLKFVDHKDSYDERDKLWFINCHNNINYDAFWARFALIENKNIIAISFVEHPLSDWGVYKNFGPILIDSHWEILRLTKDELKISSDVDGRNYILSFEKNRLAGNRSKKAISFICFPISLPAY